MRRYFIFATAGLGLLMSSIDGSVVAVAFPHLIRDLGTNVLWAAWTMSIYFIALTMGLPIGGNLSDSFGRKKVFLFSLVLFTGGSMGCGVAPNIYVLIIFRFLQGIGGASFLPTASGIVSDHFPENRQTAIGLFSGIFNIGNIIGPNLGGWIVSRYSWRYVFYINLPIGVLLIILIMALLKPQPASGRRHMDLWGAASMAGAILFLMFGLNFIAEELSFRSFFMAALFLALCSSLVLLFVRQERKEKAPILDLTLLQSRPFLATNMLNLVMGVGALGILSFIPYYATVVHGVSTLMSGMIMTPRSVGVICASSITSFMLVRWGYRRPMIWGLCIMAASMIALGGGLRLWGFAAARWGTPAVISLFLLCVGIGAGICFPAANNACIELMPDKVATIVGLRGMFRMVGAALGVSFITFAIHLSPNVATGFTITFFLCGLGLLCSLPLVFLVPPGRALN
jgi:EmrB/QacA subfamily drug resistance transporter